MLPYIFLFSLSSLAVLKPKNIEFKLNGGIVDSYNDHRIAMSFVIAGLVSEKPITIMNTLNINTSFPLFYSTLRESGVQIFQS